MAEGNLLWTIESEYSAQGYRSICGVDEAGAGPLAGPVFAAAVILPFGLTIPGLNDSKKLTAKHREALFHMIKEKALAWGVATAGEAEIDRYNILNARMLAMDRAIRALSPSADLALVDGNRTQGIGASPAVCVVGGDGKSPQIAAASILAKVSRDLYMVELAAVYPEYRFDKHKGYPTKLHYELLRKYGPCPAHRKTFLHDTYPNE
ncbi:ribonuclease HII [Papillibacter cinnamivorans]|uniref:Ribonuclease HII n=1 Tax=Papillibacter cinnamivorans DSM 12816 TaxID=1122930 RepID=A0A1W1YUY5_9FIRM|nr:ribonuclease HII [Papillibacter cinnamivorans]SMC39651.1 RNase HII [Papillibacter cinnamivorans DSM 12816]